MYTLKVALLVETPSRRRAWRSRSTAIARLYFQHPKLDYTGGDVPSAFLPNYSADTITAELPTNSCGREPTSWCSTANDDPPERDDVPPPAFIMTLLELDQDAEAKFSPAELAVQAVPTVFYTQKETGLAELVDVYVRHNAPFQAGQAVLTFGKAKYTAKLASGWDFGEQMAEFAVAEFPAGTQGEVAVSLRRPLAPTFP